MRALVMPASFFKRSPEFIKPYTTAGGRCIYADPASVFEDAGQGIRVAEIGGGCWLRPNWLLGKNEAEPRDTFQVRKTALNLVPRFVDALRAIGGTTTSKPLHCAMIVPDARGSF